MIILTFVYILYPIWIYALYIGYSINTNRILYAVIYVCALY